MDTNGGSMFHDRGFAGLPAEQYATAPKSDEHANIAPRRQGEIKDGMSKTFIDRPFGAPGLLLFEQSHSSIHRD
jgi:hypothetical protein